MIPQTTLSSVEAEAEDRSMRVVEYAMAAVAALTAAVLALLQ